MANWLHSLRYRVADWVLPKARFEGAQNTIDKSLLQAPLQSARLDITACDRQKLQGKSRYFEKNNAYINRIADLMEQYTVGTGLLVQPDTSTPAFNKAAGDYFNQWCKAPDVGSNLSFSRLQGILARRYLVDGEIFILKVIVNDEPKIQLVQGDRIKTPPGMVDGPNLYDGVVIDDYGRPTGYYIGKPGKGIGAPQVFGEPVSWENVIPILDTDYAGQNRGMPFTYAVMNDIHGLDDLQLLELQVAKSAAEKTEIIETQTGQLSPAQMRAMRIGVTKLPGQAGTTGAACADPATYYQQVLGANAKIIRTGDKYQQFSVTRPAQVTRDYWELLVEKVCTGVGIPMALVIPDSMQGTVFRGALDMAHAWFQSRWAVLAEAFTAVYVYVIDSARYKVPALQDPPGDWQKVRVHAPRAVNVDVGRNSAAMIAELGAGTTTMQAIYESQGLDAFEQLDARGKMARYVRDRADFYGVDPSEISNVQVDKPERISTEPKQPVAEPDIANPDPAADDTLPQEE